MDVILLSLDCLLTIFWIDSLTLCSTVCLMLEYFSCCVKVLQLRYFEHEAVETVFISRNNYSGCLTSDFTRKDQLLSSQVLEIT